MTTQLSPATQVSTFRRIAASMWARPSDPTIYGFVDVEVSETLAFIERFRRDTGKKLTMTHVVARAVATAFARHPELNAKVRFWGRIEQRAKVDLFVSVATGGGKDLDGVRIDGAEDLELEALVDAAGREVAATRAGRNDAHHKSRSLLGRLPWFLVRPLLWLTDLVTNELQWHLPGLGMPRDPFGTAVITNVGTFGIDTAFAPFVPLARCPMLMLVTQVRQRPWVVGDRVEPRPVLRLCATFDHRVIDGFAAGRMSEVITELVAHPAHAQPEGAQPVALAQEKVA